MNICWDNSGMARKAEKARFTMLVATSIQGIGSMTKEQVKVFILGLLAIVTSRDVHKSVVIIVGYDQCVIKHNPRNQ
jgi:hypothetical protein